MSDEEQFDAWACHLDRCLKACIPCLTCELGRTEQLDTSVCLLGLTPEDRDEKMQAAHLEKLLRRIPGVSVTRQAMRKRRLVLVTQLCLRDMDPLCFPAPCLNPQKSCDFAVPCHTSICSVLGVFNGLKVMTGHDGVAMLARSRQAARSVQHKNF